jgi:hypothetical protein
MSTILLIVGCAVFVLLGVGHAALLLFSTKFEPRDEALMAQLRRSKTGMSNTGNFWRGIQGFHLSHSLGLILFGWFYIMLALESPATLQASLSLQIGMFLVPVIYIGLAQRYWFWLPRNCFIVALGLLALAVTLR